MNLYLKRHQYGSTSTEDLWTVLGEASSDNKPIGRIMSGWTSQTGFPVISVSSQPVDGQPSKRLVQLSQRRFLADGSEDPAGTMWMVPIEIVSQQSPDKVVQSIVFEGRRTEILLDNVRPDEWFKVTLLSNFVFFFCIIFYFLSNLQINPGQIGFYRTNYSEELFKQLVPAVRQKTLKPLDRLGLIDDLFALAQAGQASSVQVLELLEAFADEDEYTVWERVCNVLGNFSQLVIDNTELHDQITAFSRRLLRGVFGRLGWDSKPDEDHSTKFLRSLVLERMAVLDDADILAESERRFDALINHGQVIKSDLRLAVYKAVLRSKSSAAGHFESLKRIYCETSLQEEKIRVSNALGSMNEESLLASALEFAVSSQVLPQHTLVIVSSVASGSIVGRRLAWDFFRKRCAEFSEQFQGAFLLTRLVKTLTKNFATEQKAMEVDSFFKVWLELNLPI